MQTFGDGEKRKRLIYCVVGLTGLLLVAAVLEYGGARREENKPRPAIVVQPPTRPQLERESPMPSPRPFTVDQLLDLLGSEIPKPMADRFAKEFLKEPALKEEWTRFYPRAPAAAGGRNATPITPSGGSASPAREMIAAMRRHTEFRSLVSRFAADPGYQGLVMKLTRHPEIESLLKEEFDGNPARRSRAAALGAALARGPGDARLQADEKRIIRNLSGPEAHNVARNLFGAPGTGSDRSINPAWRESIFPNLTTAEKTAIDNSCWKDERAMDFWQCCAAAAIGRCEQLCQGQNCGGSKIGGGGEPVGGGGEPVGGGGEPVGGEGARSGSGGVSPGSGKEPAPSDPGRPPVAAPAAEPFDWAKHNELRHQYAVKGERRRALEESNIILEHSLMDDYILNILADWQIGKDNEKAIAALLRAADELPPWSSLSRAANIRAAQLLAATSPESAHHRLLQVLRASWDPGDGYAALARAMLAELKLPSEFDWKLHNELRHRFEVEGNAEAAMDEMDIILEHSIMDEYILNVLSDWQIGKDLEQAIINLTDRYMKGGGRKFLRAAVKLKRGDLLVEFGDVELAKSGYRDVATRYSEGALATYAAMAVSRLAKLETPGGPAPCFRLDTGNCSPGCRPCGTKGEICAAVVPPPCVRASDSASYCPPGWTYGPRHCPANMRCTADMTCLPPIEFNWAVENGLRLKALEKGDWRLANAHSDRILQYSVMDGYIIALMSGRQIGQDDDKALESLVREADKNHDLRYYCSAASLKAAWLFEQAKKDREALALYRHALDHLAAAPSSENALAEPYRGLALDGSSRLCKKPGAQEMYSECAVAADKHR